VVVVCWLGPLPNTKNEATLLAGLNGKERRALADYPRDF